MPSVDQSRSGGARKKSDASEVKGTEKERIMGELKEARRRLEQAKAVKYVATHTVAAGDSLSAIAQKYYGSAVKEKWMVIYEANKELIGDNPGMIKPGQELKIPELD